MVLLPQDLKKKPWKYFLKRKMGTTVFFRSGQFSYIRLRFSFHFHFVPFPLCIPFLQRQLSDLSLFGVLVSLLSPLVFFPSWDWVVLCSSTWPRAHSFLSAGIRHAVQHIRLLYSYCLWNKVHCVSFSWLRTQRYTCLCLPEIRLKALPPHPTRHFCC